jgi:hypothetical protein
VFEHRTDVENVAATAFECSSDQEVGEIRSGTTMPANAFAAVRYRGYWFWVDDSARTTKRALTTVMFFFTLTETDTVKKYPNPPPPNITRFGRGG